MHEQLGEQEHIRWARMVAVLAGATSDRTSFRVKAVVLYGARYPNKEHVITTTRNHVLFFRRLFLRDLQAAGCPSLSMGRFELVVLDVPGLCPTFLRKHETKNPFVLSSPGKHLMKESASRQFDGQMKLLGGFSGSPSPDSPPCCKCSDIPRRGQVGSTSSRGASSKHPALASSEQSACSTTSSFSIA